jgi:hypothetical protein
MAQSGRPSWTMASMEIRFAIHPVSSAAEISFSGTANYYHAE